MPSVTVGFTARDSFAVAARCLNNLLDCTKIPFNLVLVDCNTPKKYRESIEEIASKVNNIEIISVDHYILPNQSRNLVISASKDDYVCLIENDNIVTDRWLDSLVDACEEEAVGVAMPLIIEGLPGSNKVHFPEHLGTIKPLQHEGKEKLVIRPHETSPRLLRGGKRKLIQVVEPHCLLFRRAVFESIGPLDEEISYQEEIDISLALYRSGIKIILEPRAEINYISPFPPEKEELDYYLMRWDVDSASRSIERIQKKWNLIEPSGVVGFAQDRVFMAQLLPTLRHQILQNLPRQSPFILVDGGTWQDSFLIRDLHAIPFTERNGRYWGPPADSYHAVAEFERLRGSGASHIVFVWYTFEWIEWYGGLAEYLRENCKCVLKNDRLMILEFANINSELMK